MENPIIYLPNSQQRDMYILYNDGIVIDKVSYIKDIERIYVYIDILLRKPLIDILFIITRLKDFNTPITLLTEYNPTQLPQYLLGYFDKIFKEKNIMINNHLNKEREFIHCYIRGRDY